MKLVYPDAHEALACMVSGSYKAIDRPYGMSNVIPLYSNSDVELIINLRRYLSSNDALLGICTYMDKNDFKTPTGKVLSPKDIVAKKIILKGGKQYARVKYDGTDAEAINRVASQMLFNKALDDNGYLWGQHQAFAYCDEHMNVKSISDLSFVCWLPEGVEPADIALACPVNGLLYKETGSFDWVRLSSTPSLVVKNQIEKEQFELEQKAKSLDNADKMASVLETLAASIGVKKEESDELAELKKQVAALTDILNKKGIK